MLFACMPTNAYVHAIPFCLAKHSSYESSVWRICGWNPRARLLRVHGWSMCVYCVYVLARASSRVRGFPLKPVLPSTIASARTHTHTAELVLQSRSTGRRRASNEQPGRPTVRCKCLRAPTRRRDPPHTTGRGTAAERNQHRRDSRRV